jgi:hypothetical protein
MDLFAIREEFTRSGIMICFNGPFSHSIIEEIGVAVRNHLSADNLGKDAVLNVFAVYIELAQNVKNYSAAQDLSYDDGKSCIIIIAKRDGRYVVTSGNNVLKSDVPGLTQAIDRINSLDPAGLKKLYKEQMRRDKPAEAVGAGLGLLEVARRSPDKLSYTFSEVDDKFSFFSLSAYA